MNLMTPAQFQQTMRDTAAHVAREYRRSARRVAASGSAGDAARRREFARETLTRAREYPKAPLIQRYCWGMTDRIPTQRAA